MKFLFKRFDANISNASNEAVMRMGFHVWDMMSVMRSADMECSQGGKFNYLLLKLVRQYSLLK